jgi:predicted protein tyrosine phosphatase
MPTLTENFFPERPKIGKLLVLSKSKAREFSYDKPWACISIADGPGDWPHINKVQQVDLLQLDFADFDDVPTAENPFPLCFLRPGEIRFTTEHAQQIWEFVNKVWDKIDLLMVHCLAGISRSAAVAAAIAKVKYNDDSLYFTRYRPNLSVYSILNGLLPGTVNLGTHCNSRDTACKEDNSTAEDTHCEAKKVKEPSAQSSSDWYPDITEDSVGS